MFEGMTERMRKENNHVQTLTKQLRIAVFPLFALWIWSPILGQSPVVDSPLTRMRPIGTYGNKVTQTQQGQAPQRAFGGSFSPANPSTRPSTGSVQPIASRQSRLSTPTSFIRETGYQSPSGGVRQLARPADFQPTGSSQRTVQLQQFESPLPGALPLPGAVPPNANALGGAPNLGLPPSPTVAPNGFGGQAAGPSIVSSSDQTPIPAPQLNNGFATIGNCNLVSGPSSYSAASFGGCAQTSFQAPAFPQTQAVPGQGGFAAPAILPNGLNPQSPLSGAGVPGGALISFGQQTNPVVVGQGIFGQPVAYVPGQSFRNWLRYVFP